MISPSDSIRTAVSAANWGRVNQSASFALAGAAREAEGRRQRPGLRLAVVGLQIGGQGERVEPGEAQLVVALERGAFRAEIQKVVSGQQQHVVHNGFADAGAPVVAAPTEGEAHPTVVRRGRLDADVLLGIQRETKVIDVAQQCQEADAGLAEAQRIGPGRLIVGFDLYLSLGSGPGDEGGVVRRGCRRRFSGGFGRSQRDGPQDVLAVLAREL